MGARWVTHGKSMRMLGLVVIAGLLTSGCTNRDQALSEKLAAAEAAARRAEAAADRAEEAAKRASSAQNSPSMVEAEPEIQDTEPDSTDPEANLQDHG